ncbi:vanin-like protein 3 [Anoplophora glabripennis]|nr:vanin-like protein 3 [Anoplophora glabripennis]
MTCLKQLGFLFLGLLLFGKLEESNAQSYRAVVVPYAQKEEQIPTVVVNDNTRQYVSTITQLKDDADIIVFPENGITSTTPVGDTISHNIPFSIVLQPGTKTNFNEDVLPNISSAAKSNKMYVVINVLEFHNASKEELYSTDLVFDPEGKQIATCRKKYLYKEQFYSKGNPNQDCTFEAYFRRINVNVTFAILFDTDLLVETSDKFEKIHDAVLTSSLQNELPLPFGVSLQQGFAVRNKVNLLAAGYADSSEGYGGSGIYLRNGKSKVVLTSESLLNLDVPVDQKPSDVINVVVTPPDKPDILQKVIYKNLPTSDNSSYCTFHMDPKDMQPYRWLSFTNGTELLGQQKNFVFCALIKPEESKDQPKIVNNLTIVVNLKTDTIEQVLPLSLASGSKMVPANFELKEEKKEGVVTITMNLSEPKDLSVFGVLFTLKNSASVFVSHVLFVSFLPLLSILWSKLII